MNSTISTLQQGEHSTSVFYLSLLLHLPDKAAVTDAQNKMLKTWLGENPTQWHQGRKTRRFSPLQYFVMSELHTNPNNLDMIEIQTE